MNLAGITPLPTPQTPLTHGPAQGNGPQAMHGVNRSPEQTRTQPRTGVAETHRALNPGTPGISELDSEGRVPVEQLLERDQERHGGNSAAATYQRMQQSGKHPAGALLDLTT